MPYLIVNRKDAYASKLPKREPWSRGYGNPPQPHPVPVTRQSAIDADQCRTTACFHYSKFAFPAEKQT